MDFMLIRPRDTHAAGLFSIANQRCDIANISIIDGNISTNDGVGGLVGIADHNSTIHNVLSMESSKEQIWLGA